MTGGKRKPKIPGAQVLAGFSCPQQMLSTGCGFVDKMLKRKRGADFGVSCPPFWIKNIQRMQGPEAGIRSVQGEYIGEWGFLHSRVDETAFFPQLIQRLKGRKIKALRPFSTVSTRSTPTAKINYISTATIVFRAVCIRRIKRPHRSKSPEKWFPHRMEVISCSFP